MKKILNKKNIRVFIITILFVNFFTNIILSSSVLAASNGATNVDGMWSKASSWFGKINTADNSQRAVDIVSEFSSIVNVIGTTLIVIATIFLGIKYIVGSVESKADVKESLITLLIACIFFFGWQGMSAILIPGGRLVWSSASDTSYKNLVGRTFNNVIFALNVATIAAVIYVGVRYIFSGASGKADLKSRSPYFLIGIIMAFCSVSFLTFVSNVVNDMFQ